MKKRIFAVLLTGVMLCLMAACSGGSGNDNSSTGLNLEESSTGAKVNEDFSKNVNTNRASDYAKNELKLPVEGIGRGISTEVKADKK